MNTAKKSFKTNIFPHDDILKEEVKKNIKKHGVLTNSSVLLGSDSSACVNNKFSQRNANQHTFSKGLSPVCDTDISQKCLQFGKYPSDTYLPADENTKEYLKCTKDYSVLREFSTAGGKKITVSQNSLNAAKSLLNEDLVEGESMKKDIKKHRESKEILATDTKKKFSKRSLKIEKALSNDNDHDALGDENSVILKYLEKNGDHRTLSVKLSDLSIERKKFLIENTKHNMNFKGLATRGEKENVSEESLFHHSLLTDEITSITTNKNKISVLEDPLDLKKYSLDEVLTESKNIVSASKGVKQKLDSKEISITDSKIAKFVPSDEVLNGNTKCLEYNERHEQHNFSVMVRDDSSENEKITLSSENREQRSVCKGFSTADGRKILVSEKSLEFARNVFDENLVKNENNESFVNNIKHLTNSSSVSFIGDKEDCVLMKDQLSENNVFVQKGWSMSTGIAGELEHAFVSDEVSLTDNLLDNKDLVEEYKPTSCIFNVNFDSVSKPLLKNHDVPLTISKQFPVVVGKETEKYARCLDKHDVVGKQLLGEIQNFAKRKQINCLKSEVIKVSDERQALNSNMKRKVVQGKNDMVFCENTHLSEKPRSSDYRCCIPPEQKICKTPLHVMSSLVIHDRRSAHCPVLPMSSNPLYFQSQFANTSCDQTSYISDFKKSTFITPYKKTSISPVVYGVKRPRTPIEDETIFPWKKSVKHYDIFSRTCQQNMECSKVYEVKNAITGIQQPQNKVVNVELGKAQDVHYNQLELHTKNQEVVYKQPCQNQNKVHQENLEKNKFHFQKEGKIENNVIYQANMRCFEDNKKNKNYFKSQSKDQHQETVNSEDQVINSEIQRTVKTNLGDHKTEKINLEEQKTKTNSREKKMLKVQSGMLWRMIHAENHRRFKLKQLAREKYASGNPESLVAAGIQRRTLTVTASTAENFVFFLPDHLGQNVSEMINGIPVGDGAHLIPTADLKVGKEEFFWALLHSPSVDPSLVNRLWVYNHYHWIVWKLAAMEVAFPDILGGRYLTLHHVMLQLKYRYDREIEHCERSALKKILERDDTPAKTLVLCVSNVISDKNEKLKLATALQQNMGLIYFTQNYEVQVELTDGWYSIQAQLDSPLIRIVQQGRLKVGQKLITSGAELIGSDKACSPLEVSSDLKLKLSTNSTRRARWDLRLGFFHCPVPFPVSLSSLFPDGGTVGCVEIVVVQLYPLQYMEKTSDGRKVFRNETMEVKSVEKHQKLQEYYLEKVKAKLQTNMEKKELEMEMKSDKQKRYHQLTKSYVENITSGKELYQLLQDADDPVFYESILSKSQEENLRSYQQELQQKKLSEFQEQLKLAVSEEKERGEFPEDRVVVPLLKAKVLGISSKDRKHKKFAMLLFWNPSKDVIQMIVEGQVVKLYHLNIRKRNEILELSSTRHTRLEKLSKSKDTLEMVISPKQPISLVNLCNPDFKPLEEEVDVVGLVFSVEFSNNNATDTILLTDGKLNIISIKVFGGLSSISAEGIVKVGSYMLARNLRFQNKTCLIATEGSIFTTSSTIAEFQELKRSIKDETATIQSALNLFHTCSSNHHKVSGMLAGCQTSYSLHPLTSPSYNPKHTPSRRAYPTYSPVSHMNEGGKSSSTISIPSNSHNRISQLEKYRCPPPLSITSMTSPMYQTLLNEVVSISSSSIILLEKSMSWEELFLLYE
ncbi:uncharacterized protein LOC143225246 isoform X2 [Tachypleus tridentatus]|uniref:uncharacterized protein LOC143225246 isoform X2 n=1 Tax=Tachypleus tridentatus TaxID=6853 RepID=UPI003FD051BD